MKITVKEKEYELSLSMRSCVDLEDRLNGINPLQIVSDWDENHMPTFKQLGLFFWAMLKDNSKVTLDEAYDIMYGYLQDGRKIIDLVDTIITVFDECGYVGTQEDTEKN